MAHYTNISQEEMEKFLFPQGFQKITLPNVFELVYGKRVDHNNRKITLRIYTGINQNGNSRPNGEDAIRCTLFWKDGENVRKIGGNKRVNRVENWRTNLQSRIDVCHEMLGPDCPMCKMPMVLRDGKHGDFWGCSGFPDCKKTMQIRNID